MNSPAHGENPSVRVLLRDVVNQAISSGRTTHIRIVESGAVSNGALGRLRNGTTNVGIDALDKLAVHLGLQPWQLLAQGIDGSTQSDVHSNFSSQALALGRALESIEDPVVMQEAFTSAVALLSLFASVAQGTSKRRAAQHEGGV